MTKLCKFTLTWEEKRAIQDCCFNKATIHHRAFKRAIKNPSGRGGKDDEVQEKHFTLMKQYEKISEMFDDYDMVDEDSFEFEEYLCEEETYKLLSEALVYAPGRRGPEFAENALTKIGENFI